MVGWFCRHEWKVLDKTVLPSAYEQLIESGQSPTSLEVKGHDTLFTKKAITVIACSKCGAMRLVKLKS